MKYFPRALLYLKPYVRLAVAALALIGLGVLVSLLVPWPLKFIFDNVLGGGIVPGVDVAPSCRSAAAGR